MLLIAVQMFVNLQQLLKEGRTNKEGYDYVPITKTITNETMGQPEKNLFNTQELAELKKQPFIEGVSPLTANEFRVKLGVGAMLPFSTDLFLESLDQDFIDTLPPQFNWKEGETQVPMILSLDFLEMYNVFAPSQGLPQVSKETAMGIPLQIICYDRSGQETRFGGNIVAFSSRVQSVLVPKEFLEWANAQFTGQPPTGFSRLFLKLKDVNNPQLLRFLGSKHYNINRDTTLLGRNKMLLQGFFSGLAVFGLLVIILALMLFSFYLQLVIARSRESLQLLLTLGYSPQWLGNKLSKRFVPVYVIIVLACLGITQVAQLAFHRFLVSERPELTPVVHWAVLLTALVLILLAVFANKRMVNRLLQRL